MDLQSCFELEQHFTRFLDFLANRVGGGKFVSFLEGSSRTVLGESERDVPDMKIKSFSISAVTSNSTSASSLLDSTGALLLGTSCILLLASCKQFRVLVY